MNPQPNTDKPKSPFAPPREAWLKRLEAARRDLPPTPKPAPFLNPNTQCHK